MKKITLTIIVLFICTFSMTIFAQDDTQDVATGDNVNSGIYNGVPKDHWAYDAIMFLTERGELPAPFPTIHVDVAIVHMPPDDLIQKIRDRIQSEEYSKMQLLRDFRKIAGNDENALKKILQFFGIEDLLETQDVPEGE